MAVTVIIPIKVFVVKRLQLKLAICNNIPIVEINHHVLVVSE